MTSHFNINSTFKKKLQAFDDTDIKRKSFLEEEENHLIKLEDFKSEKIH